MRIIFFFTILFLVSCGDQKTQDKKPAKTDSVVAEKKLTPQDKAQMDSITLMWPEMDQLEFSVEDYSKLWNAVSTEKPDTVFLFNWLEKNKMKYAGKDKYFVMHQVLGYFFWKLVPLQDFDHNKVSPEIDYSIHNLRLIENRLFDGQIVYHCVEQDPPPVSSTYFFLKDGSVRMYSCFTFCDVELAKWKKQKGKMIFSNGDIKYTFTETDSSFIPDEGQKTRTLIKFRYNEIQ